MKPVLEFFFNFLFIDQSTGKVSTSKFWMNVGSAVLCVAVVVNLIKPLQLDANLLLVFAGTVLASRGFEKFLLQKMGYKDDASSAGKSDSAQG